MPLLRYDFAVDQNADVGPLPFNWGMLDPSGDPRLTTYPYSLAGATVKAQIRAARDAGALLYCALTVGSGLALTAVAIAGRHELLGADLFEVLVAVVAVSREMAVAGRE